MAGSHLWLSLAPTNITINRHTRSALADGAPALGPLSFPPFPPVRASFDLLFRFRKNAGLTDEKEIEAKLALGEFVRKGECVCASYSTDRRTAAIGSGCSPSLQSSHGITTRDGDAVLTQKVPHPAATVR